MKFINKACGSVFLIIGKPQAPPAQLLLEDAILLDEVGDAVGLVALDDAGDGEQQDAEWVGGGGHQPRVDARARFVYRR